MTTATDTFLTYAQAKNDGDLDAAMSVWHPDAVLSVPAAGLDLYGRDQARAFFAAFIDAVDGYHGEVVNLAADSETVLADWVLHGALTGPLLGAEPTGAQLELPVVSIAHIRDGGFMAETLRFDLATLARQAALPLASLIDLLGLQPTAGQESRDRPPTEDLDRLSVSLAVPERATTPSRDRSTAEAEAFLDAFVEGWRRPQPVEEFLHHFLPLVDPDVRLRQPLGSEDGHDGFRRLFRRLFTLMPDVHAEVRDVFVQPDGLVIILRMHGSLGASPYAWDLVDRITLRSGRLIERRAHFDPLPLFAAVIRRPTAWPRAIRSLLM